MRTVSKFLLWSFSIALIAQLAGASSTLAQEPAKPPKVKVEEIAPRPEDVSTLDGIIVAYYETITGPAGQPREWARDRTLYIPEIKFISIEMHDGQALAKVMSHQAYVDDTDAYMVKNGFFEREIHRVTRRFGNIAQVFSTYEARTTRDGPVISRGINSIELYYDGARWWITAAMWEDERPENPIPKEFLP
jgi:hypothetical protein